VNSNVLEGKAIPAPLVTPVMSLLNYPRGDTETIKHFVHIYMWTTTGWHSCSFCIYQVWFSLWPVLLYCLRV